MTCYKDKGRGILCFFCVFFEYSCATHSILYGAKGACVSVIRAR